MSKDRINPATGKAYRAKGASDPLRMPWVADAGSVFTEDVVEAKSEAGEYVYARISITFKVGNELAEHIVSLHNAKI